MMRMDSSPASLHQETPAPGNASRRRLVAAISRVWSGIQSFVFGVMPVLLGAALIALVLREMSRDDIEVAPIQVPSRLSDAGLTPDVTAYRLLDQIFAAQQAAQVEVIDRPRIELAGEQPDFSVPIAGLSLRSLATLLRSVIGRPPRRVTGEIVLADNQLRIRLRIAGRGRIADVGGFPVDNVDGLLAAAAPEVWRVLHPRLFAWHVAQTEPTEVRVRERLGQMLRTGGLDPATERTLKLLIGRSFVRSSRGEDAFAVLDGLTRASPDYALGWYWRGRAQELRGQDEEALADYRRAQQLDPRAYWVHVGVAELLRDRGDLPAALAEVRLALAANDDEPGALTEQAEVLLAMGRPAEALASARFALLGDPNNAAALMVAGRSLLTLGDPAGAQAEFDAAARRTPRSIAAHLRRAEGLLALRRPEEAAAALEVAAELGPPSPALAGLAARLQAALPARPPTREQ